MSDSDVNTNTKGLNGVDVHLIYSQDNLKNLKRIGYVHTFHILEYTLKVSGYVFGVRSFYYLVHPLCIHCLSKMIKCASIDKCCNMFAGINFNVALYFKFDKLNLFKCLQHQTWLIFSFEDVCLNVSTKEKKCLLNCFHYLHQEVMFVCLMSAGKTGPTFRLGESA